MIVAVPIGIIIQNMNEEGLFDTTKNSIRILVAQINQFRRLNKDDLACIKIEMEQEKEEFKEEKGG